MSSESSKGRGKSVRQSGPVEPRGVVVIRSLAPQQAFVARALEALELVEQPGDRSAMATRAMEAAFQIERQAIELGLRVIAEVARTLGVQAAEIYVQEPTAIAMIATKPTIDALSALLLRVYLTGGDVEANKILRAPAEPRSTSVSKLLH
jgi:hypothetical protein